MKLPSSAAATEAKLSAITQRARWSIILAAGTTLISIGSACGALGALIASRVPQSTQQRVNVIAPTAWQA